jgi:hypothetical protein
MHRTRHKGPSINPNKAPAIAPGFSFALEMGVQRLAGPSALKKLNKESIFVISITL